MSTSFAIAIYFIIWWLVLFTILPIGVKTQDEEGGRIAGTPPSAPGTPRIVWKMAITTIVAGIVFGVFYWIFTAKLITLDKLPF